MSRCYRISVSESLQRHIQVDDGLQTHLELLDILPPEQMQALLGEQLSERDYHVSEGTVWQKSLDNGVVINVDTRNGTVDISLSDEAELALERQRSTTAVDVNPEQVEAKLRDRAREQLEKEATEAAEALRLKVTRKLEGALSSIRRELDQAVNKATGAALKQKARQLGEVTEISEDPETGAVTIRVKVG